MDGQSSPQIETYLEWLRERGQRVVRGACLQCGYAPTSYGKYLVCYENMDGTELKLLKEAFPALRSFQLTRIFACPSRGGENVCVKQRRGLRNVGALVILGEPVVRLLGGRKWRFVRDRGRVLRRQRDWERTQIFLTYHPRDVLRFPANAMHWRRDLALVENEGVWRYE